MTRATERPWSVWHDARPTPGVGGWRGRAPDGEPVEPIDPVSIGRAP